MIRSLEIKAHPTEVRATNPASLTAMARVLSGTRTTINLVVATVGHVASLALVTATPNLGTKPWLAVALMAWDAALVPVANWAATKDLVAAAIAARRRVNRKWICG